MKFLGNRDEVANERTADSEGRRGPRPLVFISGCAVSLAGAGLGLCLRNGLEERPTTGSITQIRG